MQNNKINSLVILKFYLSYLKKYKFRVAALMAIVPLANICLRILPPLIVANIISRLTKHSYVSGDLFASFGKDLIIYAVIVILGSIILWRVAIYLVWTLEGYVVRDIYRSIHDKYIKLDSDFHANNFGGSLVSRASKLTGAYIRIFDTFLFQFYLMLVAYTAISIIMYPKSPIFVYGMWVTTIFYIVFSMIISKKVRHYATEEANAQNKATGYIADAVTNVMTIKSFAKSKYENRRFADVTENVRHKTLRLMWSTTIRDIYSSAFTSFVGIGALVIATYAVVVGNAEISLVFLLFTYAADITDRLWEFNSSALRNYNRAIGDASEGVQTMLTEPKINNPAKPAKLSGKIKHIVFKDVNFAHNDSGDKVLFSNFNLDIKPGTKIGLVGHSGSGKTTLVRLLMRYIDRDSGQIKIGDSDIMSITQDNLHSQIAYVPQEPLLFHRSLAENIGYGKEDATDKEIQTAAKLAHCHEFIKDLPDGYNTLVGERGIKLSGGQRQRVAIARAILKDAPILVLDEATSALDSESESLIQKALKELMKGRTTIVIAHRLSTIQNMDRIIVLSNGVIAEDGNHKQLLANKNIYSNLWTHQSGGFLEE